MQRVKSDDINADDEECPKEDKMEDKKLSPIGAGLPLLQRLRLLKEKQVRFRAFLIVLYLLFKSIYNFFLSLSFCFNPSFKLLNFDLKIFICFFKGVTTNLRKSFSLK